MKGTHGLLIALLVALIATPSSADSPYSHAARAAAKRADEAAQVTKRAAPPPSIRQTARMSEMTTSSPTARVTLEAPSSSRRAATHCMTPQVSGHNSTFRARHAVPTATSTRIQQQARQAVLQPKGPVLLTTSKDAIAKSGHTGHWATYNLRAGEGPYDNIRDRTRVGPGRKFSQTQKERIRQQNLAMNGHQMRDDITGEIGVWPKKHQKGVTPPPNEVHVDHRYPRSKGGSNDYANAALRLRKHNLAKSDRIE